DAANGACDETCGAEGEECSRHRADGRCPQRLREDVADESSAWRTEGEPDAKFLSALCDDVAQHAVDTRHRHAQGDDADCRRDPIRGAERIRLDCKRRLECVSLLHRAWVCALERTIETVARRVGVT